MEALFGIIGAMIGAVAGIGSTYIVFRAQRRRDNRISAAYFLEGLADNLDGMIERFKENKIPRVEGNALDEALPRLQSIIQPHIGDEATVLQRRFRDLTQGAEDIDGTLYRNENPIDEEKDGWIVEAERLAGIMKGKAAILKSTPS